MVVTNRQLLIDQSNGKLAGARATHVVAADGKITAAVERLYLPDSVHTDAALLRLAEPVPATPLRLGYPKLMRIGDRVWATGQSPGTDQEQVLLPGLVDRFDSFPEESAHLVKAGFRVPPSGSGSPLFNDLGEVVAILTINQDQATTAGDMFALPVDILDPLLASAGSFLVPINPQ